MAPLPKLTSPPSRFNLFCAEELSITDPSTNSDTNIKPSHYTDNKIHSKQNHQDSCPYHRPLIALFHDSGSSLAIGSASEIEVMNYSCRCELRSHDELSELRIIKERESESLSITHHSHGPLDQCPMVQGSIDWMLNVCGHFGFDQSTAFLSVSYFNRVLHHHTTAHDDGHDSHDNHFPQGCSNAWFLQLLAVACVSLAAKLEEVEVPLLLNLQVAGPAYIFEPRTIQRMELLVLSSLDWRLNLVTPFCYIHYLMRKPNHMDSSPRADISALDHCHMGDYTALLQRIKDRILATCRDSRFLKHRSCEVAVATLMSCCGCGHCRALLERCTREGRGSSRRPLQSGGPEQLLATTESEGIIECVKLMQSLPDTFGVTEPPAAPAIVSTVKRTSESTHVQAIGDSPMGVLDHAESGSPSCASCGSYRHRPPSAASDWRRRIMSNEYSCGIRDSSSSSSSTVWVPGTKRRIDFESVLGFNSQAGDSLSTSSHHCSTVASRSGSSSAAFGTPTSFQPYSPRPPLPRPALKLTVGPCHGDRDDDDDDDHRGSKGGTSARKRKVKESYAPISTRSSSHPCS